MRCQPPPPRLISLRVLDGNEEKLISIHMEVDKIRTAFYNIRADVFKSSVRLFHNIRAVFRKIRVVCVCVTQWVYVCTITSVCTIIMLSSKTSVRM